MLKIILSKIKQTEDKKKKVVDKQLKLQSGATNFKKSYKDVFKRFKKTKNYYLIDSFSNCYHWLYFF